MSMMTGCHDHRQRQHHCRLAIQLTVKKHLSIEFGSTKLTGHRQHYRPRCHYGYASIELRRHFASNRPRDSRTQTDPGQYLTAYRHQDPRNQKPPHHPMKIRRLRHCRRLVRDRRHSPQQRQLHRLHPRA
jgi:hypothetical protein